MFEKLVRLKELLEYLGDAILSTKEVNNVTAEQVLKAESINIGENSNLNIQQNQYIVIHSADRWIFEAKGIADSLLAFAPNESLPLYDALKIYKRTIVRDVFAKADKNKNKASMMLGITPRQLRYIISEDEKESKT